MSTEQSSYEPYLDNTPSHPIAAQLTEIANQLNAQEIRKFWEQEEAKLRIIDRRYCFAMSGSLQNNINRVSKDKPSAFFFKIDNDRLDMFRLSARIESSATPTQQAALKGKEVLKRASSIEHTYILSIHILSAKNSYPIPLTFSCTGASGNLYTPSEGEAGRGLHRLSLDCNQYWDSIKNGAPCIHKIAPGFSLRQALAAKALTPERFNSKLGTYHDMCFFPGGQDSILVKMITEAGNLEAISLAGQDNPAVKQAFSNMSFVEIGGKQVVQFSKDALPFIRAVITDYHREISGRVESVNMTDFSYWFAIASNGKAITPSTLKDHENFVGMSAARASELLNDGLRCAEVVVQMRFIPLTQEAIDSYSQV